MPPTIQTIRTLSNKTLKSLTSTKENWTGFLNSAAYTYKYSFYDQLLIHAQRPDATACAPYELWNRMGRYVKRGAKGIALIHERGNNPALSYVFDVSDTGSRDKALLNLWEVGEEHEHQILEELANHFGEIDAYKELSFSDQLAGVVNNVITDNINDYLDELEKASAGSALDGMNVDDMQLKLHDALIYSIHYTVMARLGLNPDEYYAHTLAAAFISVFDTPEVITVLGMATNHI